MTPAAMLGGIVLGLVVGAISGLIGIGGGAFLIPALVFFFGMSQLRAQGTSITTLLLPIGIFAFWEYYKNGQVDIKLALLISLGFALGGWLGGSWAQRIPEDVLRKAFAILLVLIATKLAFFTRTSH
jgi:uncharacterized membrane protein YfcA